jgi:hypothetical protein
MERNNEKQGWFIDSHEGNIKEAYHFVEKLANGGFGIVYLAEHRKTSNNTFFLYYLFLTSNL